MQRMGWLRAGTALLGLPLAAALAAAPAATQEPRDTLQVHLVRPGDTLWDLARRYLRDPYRWPEIHRLNQATIRNPHLIFPSERVRIPLLALPGDTVPGAWPRVTDRDAALRERTVFFLPDAAMAAEHRLRLAEQAPPAHVTRGDYLRAGMLLGESQVAPVGRLVELLNPSVVPLRIPQQIQLYDRVYMTVGRPGSVRPGDRLHLVREGRRIRPFGRIYEATGVVAVIEVEGAVATVVVEEMFDVVAVGDAALPLPTFETMVGVQRRAATGVEGTIVAFRTPHALQSVEDVAFLDVGAGAGIREGDEFVAVLPPERRSWGVRPEIEVARLRIVRATPQTAAARVIDLEQPALEPGLRVRLVSRTQ